MNSTYIISNINERELLRSLAKINRNTFATHVLNSLDFSKKVLLHNGIVLKEKEISNIKMICIIRNILNDVSYFNGSSFQDAKNVLNAITYLRYLCEGDEETKLNDILKDGEFKEKNNAILDVYKKYISYLKDNNYIDSIGIINKVISLNLTIDGEINYLNETPLEPLEIKLLDVVSKNSFKKISVLDLINNDKSSSNITYDKAYGSINEVEYILSYIAKNNIALEDSLIVLIDNSYLNQFNDYSRIYNLPMTYGTGLPLSSSSSYRLFKLFSKWNQEYNSLNSLKEIINSDDFNSELFFNNISNINLTNKNKDKLIEYVGYLKLNTIDNTKTLNEFKTVFNDEYLNFELIENISNELLKGYAYLIKTYTNIKDNFNQKAMDYITSFIEEYNSNTKIINIEETLLELSNKNINRELSSPSKLHITDINGAIGIYRKHVFICGLSSKVFPGSPSENYLLLDSDLERFNIENVKNSINTINQKKELLINLISIYKSHNSDIHLSYSSFNLSELKEENPSSMIYEIYKLENDPSVSIDDLNKEIGDEHKYFDEDISSLKSLGLSYINSNILKIEENTNTNTKDIYPTFELSPSSIEIFFECPKRFYLIYLLGIKEPYEDDPFNILPASDEGSLIHACMEDLANKKLDEDEFINNSKQKLDNFFKKRIPPHTKTLNKIKEDFLETALVGYELSKDDDVVGSEISLSGEIDGIKFKGRVDRIIHNDDDTYSIIDFKTNRDFKHIEDDINTCLQVVIYAYLYELGGHKVRNGIFRYLKNKKEICCIYHEDMKNQLINKLKIFKEALNTGVFNCAEDKEACKYCKLKEYCGK